MRDEYEEVKRNCESSLIIGYDFERFKGLPFSSDVFIIGNSEKYLELVDNLTRQIRNLSNAVLTVTDNIKSNDYSVNISIIKNSTQEFKRNRYNDKYAELFSNNFSQMLITADSVGVEFHDLNQKLNDLCTRSKSHFTFMEEMYKFVHEYIQIEPYLNVSEYDQNELNVYKEELNELTQRFSSVIEQVHNYENFEFKHLTEQDIYDFNDIKIELSSRITEKDPTIQLNVSELYNREITLHSGDLASFMVDKKYEDRISNRITLTASQEIQDYIIFDDNSVGYKKNGIYQVAKDKKDLRNVFSELEHSIISYQLRKKPKLAKYIAQLYTDSGYHTTPVGDLDNVLIVIDTYLNHEQILKNMKLDLNIFKDKGFEAIDDYMHGLIGQHKLNQYANSILSNKNKHLLNQNSLESFKVLMDSGVSKAVIQNLIGKKLAAINTPEEFETYLIKVVDHVSGFSEDILMDKLNTSNINPVYKENNVVVFEIDTFEQSQLFGSPSWCISRSSYYFNSYKGNDSHQYFLYDFNRSEKDNLSMIGFTIQQDGLMKTQHSKNDDYHNVDDFLQKIVNKILYTDKDEYNLSSDRLKSLEQEFDPKFKKNLKTGNTL